MSKSKKQSGAVRLWVMLTCVLPLVLLVGCYSHAYHRRSPVAANSRVAIDENLPVEATQWSYLWGLFNDAPFSPEAGVCDNKGAGKVVVSTPWYGVPVSLVSLGIVSPAVVTLYCNTEPTEVGEGP